MAASDWSRRRFLTAAWLGCSAAAHPLVTPAVFASAPWDARLVVLILRGGLDGLDVLRPSGDRDFVAARPTLGKPGVDLDGRFTLHPAMSALHPLWTAGEFGAVHAVSTPYRDKRSHFEGQDLLEAGTGMDVEPGARRGGWLNRMLQSVPGVSARTAFAIGQANPLILSGPAPVSNWSPETKFAVSAQAALLLETIYHDTPLFRDALTEALTLAEEAGSTTSDVSLAQYAADQLRGETRIATFSLGGWDTHRGQAGWHMNKRLEQLGETILALREGLGPIWERTTVIAMTEFGRSLRENDAQGTDHGTGGALLLAGGAIRGGRVHGRWPGLAAQDLYAGRDLMPTGDVRGSAAWVMRGLFGLDRSVLERDIFPGLDMGDDPNLLL
ncbi:MAG: DUF1501 domain-containing protein [Pikeienuella sp.]